MSETSPVQRYGPTSGTITGVIGLVCCAFVAVAALAGGVSTTSLQVALGALALGVLAWAFLLKPRIIVEEGERMLLLLRNPLVSHRVPLAAVKVVGVRTVTTVKTEDERFDAVAVGYPLRKIVRGNVARPAHPTPGLGIPHAPLPAEPRHDRKQHHGSQDIQMLMTDRILAAAERARASGQPAGAAERRYAVAEIGLLAVLGIVFVVTLFV